MELTLEQWQVAFMKAEGEAAEHFNHQTCALENKHGKSECPMCFLSIRMKHHLGLELDTKTDLAEKSA